MSAASGAPAGAKPMAKKAMNTAQKVAWISILAVVSSLLAALGVFASSQRQATGLQSAAGDTSRVLDVMNLQIALMEADSAATSAFLVGGLEPQDRRNAYDHALAQAATLLADLAQDAGEEHPVVAQLTVDLTSYSALVEAARVNNRQGFPVGSAYLDQASTLVREQMLPQVDVLLRSSADDAASGFAANGWYVVAMVALVVSLAVLIVCQSWLARLTHRRLNGGLLLASVLMVFGLIVAQTASGGAALAAGEARDEHYRPTLEVAQATVLVAQARSLESFTLIQRGSGQAWEDEFDALTAVASELLADHPTSVREPLTLWLYEHERIRELDDSGDWDGAVELAISDSTGSASEAFDEFMAAAAVLIEEGTVSLENTLSEGVAAARRTAWIVAIVGVLALVVSWLGTAARREEYR